MSILIDRSDGRVIGPTFVIERTFTPADMSRIDPGLRGKKNARTQNLFPDDCITAFRSDDQVICLFAKRTDTTLLGLTLIVWRSGQSWDDWNAAEEMRDLKTLTDILVRSQIKNGEHLTWGMAQAYFEPRSAESCLRIDYLSKYVTQLPAPMPNSPILP